MKRRLLIMAALLALLPGAKLAAQCAQWNPFQRFSTMTWILGTGQSLSLGQLSNNAINSFPGTWRNQVVMTQLGIRPLVANATAPVLVGSTITGLVSLFEQSGLGDNNGQTIAYSMLYSVEDYLLANSKPQLLLGMSENGEGGTPYTGLEKGTQPYANALTTITRVTALAAQFGVSTVVPVLDVIHGENDCGDTEGTYESDLFQWIQDYNTDIEAITGQSQQVVMFTDQVESCPGYSGITQSQTPLAQLQASIDHPTWITCVGTKYQLPYVGGVGANGAHLLNTGEQWNGELHGQVYNSYIVGGTPWVPLSPSTITIAANVITANFNVPVPPLVFDTTLVTDPGNVSGSCPGAACRGFEYSDDSGSSPTISTVALGGGACATANTCVVITLSGTPSVGINHRFLSYAYTGSNSAGPGPTAGPRGNLRDSNTAVGGYSGEPLYNWTVTFHDTF